MKRTLPVIFGLTIALVLTGCAKIAEPDGPDDSLLIGAITLEAKGFKEKSDMRIDGEHSRNITITLRNLETEEDYLVKVVGSGLFWSNKIPKGVYYIRGYSFVLERDNFKYTLNSGPPFLVTLAIEPGKVTNLGALLWYTDDLRDENELKQVKNPEEFRKMLLTEFPDSAWHKREWISISL